MFTQNKRKSIYINFLIFCIFTLFAFQFCEEIQVTKEKIYYTLHPVPVPGATDDQYTILPVETTGEEWFLDAPMIYHAGGEIHGNCYTNSREAVEETLSEGQTFIEIDFRYTSDGHLVCAHSWPDVYTKNYQPTLEEFLSCKIQGKFTPMTAEDLIDILKENPNMYLVTDVKEENLAEVVAVLAGYAEFDPDVLSRFIIQLYTPGQKASVLEVYPFHDAQFLFTLYEWGVFQMEAAAICNAENIAVITVQYGQISDEDVSKLRNLGFTIYEHTVNRADFAQMSLNRGISGFYTDTLSPSDLIP